MSQNTLEWLGAFPDHWEVMPNKALIKKVKRPVKVGEQLPQLLSLTKQGVIVRNLEEGGKFPDNFDTYQIVKPGDLVTCLFDVPETPRTIGISRHHGMITGAYDVFEFTDRIHPEYFEYVYLYLDDQKALSYFYTGLRNVIRTPTFLSIPTPVPPLEEQRAIANYLDEKLRNTAQLVSKMVSIQSPLQERLDRNLDDIFKISSDPSPIGWSTKRVSQLGSIINGHPFDAESFASEGEVPLVRIRDIKADRFETFIAQSLVPSNAYVFDGDVVIGMDGDFNCVRWTNGKAALNQRVALVRCEDSRIAEFLSLVLPFHLKRINDLTYSTTVKHLSASQIKNIKVNVPKSEDLGALLNRSREILQLLRDAASLSSVIAETVQEHFASSISAAVTGKIDVRELSRG